MDVKKDILWRVYISFFVVVGIGVLIFGKAFYIQQVQGKMWRSMSDSLHQRIEEIPAQRGTIYSEDGEMLSTSIPQFDVYVDFAAQGLRENNGKRFRENVDSLSWFLAKTFGSKSQAEYRRLLQSKYAAKPIDRNFKLLDDIGYRELQELNKFPLVRMGKYKSGFKYDKKDIRLNPYQLLAFRTIGLDRDSFKVGLEMRYDSILSGQKGKRLVRYLAGGVRHYRNGFNAYDEK
jgi:cell division protein FtsI (penicillin-binding protein 3)